MPQYYLPKKSRIADRLHHWAIHRWFPVLADVAPRWPRWWEHLKPAWTKIKP